MADQHDGNLDGQPGLIRNQNVSAEKLSFARSLRHEMSPVERRLWLKLRSRQICGAKFRRQQIVGPYIADFYCSQAMLTVEVDGDTHNAQYDAARDRYFAQQGIQVLRFTNAEVLRNIDGVIYMIAEALSTRS